MFYWMQEWKQLHDRMWPEFDFNTFIKFLLGNLHTYHKTIENEHKKKNWILKGTEKNRQPQCALVIIPLVYREKRKKIYHMLLWATTRWPSMRMQLILWVINTKQQRKWARDTVRKDKTEKQDLVQQEEYFVVMQHHSHNHCCLIPFVSCY